MKTRRLVWCSLLVVLVWWMSLVWAQQPRYGGTLRIAFGVTTSNYDLQQGASNSVLTHLYSNLVRLNPVDGLKTIVPDVAESFVVAPNGLAYTFTLRSGVQFHDGTPLTADDVVATYNRMIFPPQGIVSLLKDRYAAVAKVEAVDPRTVKFTMNEPSAIFLLLLTDTTPGRSCSRSTRTAKSGRWSETPITGIATCRILTRWS